MAHVPGERESIPAMCFINSYVYGQCSGRGCLSWTVSIIRSMGPLMGVSLYYEINIQWKEVEFSYSLFERDSLFLEINFVAMFQQMVMAGSL